jgi:hypothetical protein
MARINVGVVISNYGVQSNRVGPFGLHQTPLMCGLSLGEGRQG